MSHSTIHRWGRVLLGAAIAVAGTSGAAVASTAKASDDETCGVLLSDYAGHLYADSEEGGRNLTFQKEGIVIYGSAATGGDEVDTNAAYGYVADYWGMYVIHMNNGRLMEKAVERTCDPGKTTPKVLVLQDDLGNDFHYDLVQ